MIEQTNNTIMKPTTDNTKITADSTRPYYYKNGYNILAASPSWEGSLYSFMPDGKGDLNFRNPLFGLCHNDPKLVEHSRDLLKQRKRWPDEFNHPNDARNRLDKWLADRRHKRDPEKYPHTKYRNQRGMTRDPFITCLFAMYMLPDYFKLEDIRKLKIPWYINRPDLWHWKRYLYTGKRWHKRRYEWWSLFSIQLARRFGFPAFVRHLCAIKAYAADSDLIMGTLRPDIPHWNYADKLLCCIPTYHLLKTFVEYYVAKRGYQWQAEQWIPEKEALNQMDIYKLDKDFLQYLWNRTNLPIKGRIE
jgi:hypothetical protein